MTGWPSAGGTQEVEDLSPPLADIEAVALRFDGTRSIVVPLRRPIDLSEPVSIEFWLAASWRDDLPYDACVLSFQAGGEVLLSLRVSGKRDRVGIETAERYLTVPAVFDPRLFHHLAIVVDPSGMEILLDGVSGGLNRQGVAAGRADTVEVGACGPQRSNFAGAVAGLRIWETPLSETNILDYIGIPGDVRGEDHPREPFLRVLTVADGRTANLVDADDSRPEMDP